MKSWPTTKQVGLIVGLACVATILSAVFHPKRPAWYRVTSAEELRWQILPEEAVVLAREKSVLWIDARSRTKFEEAHLDGAILLNMAEWGDLMFQHMDALQEAMDSPVIVYCDGEDCGKSLQVAQQLRELIGLDPVYVLKGDWRLLLLGSAARDTGESAPLE